MTDTEAEAAEPQFVNDSPVPDALMALTRQIGTAALAFALGRQWIEGDVATLLTAIGASAFVAYGQWKTWKRATQLQHAARGRRTMLKSEKG